MIYAIPPPTLIPSPSPITRLPTPPPPAATFQLWIALPQCVGGVPVPPDIDVAVSHAEKALLQAMNGSAHTFFGSHSLGGAMVQTLAQAQSAQGKCRCSISQRNSRNQ